jgi:hypothetical protein
MTEIETAVGSAVKVTCSKDELTRALSVVGRAVSTRASVQVLGGVLLRGGEGSLELAATDMELSLRLSALVAFVGRDNLRGRTASRSWTRTGTCARSMRRPVTCRTSTAGRSNSELFLPAEELCQSGGSDVENFFLPPLFRVLTRYTRYIDVAMRV